MTAPIDCAASPSVTQIKLYGERNTGTNFVQSLLRANFTQRMLRGISNADEKQRRRKLFRPKDDWLISRVVKDRFDTHVNNTRLIPEEFGWKHINPPVDYLLSVPDRTAETLFVMLVKHPVFWSVSFLKRPYHSFFRYDGMTFSEFVRHPFIPTGRDNVPEAVFESVVDLYAAKVDGYRRLAEAGVRHEIVRYEHLIQNVGAFLTRLEAHGLARRDADRPVIREAGTKKDTATLADFQEKYRLDNVRKVVTPEDHDFIMSRFGAERLRWLGYSQT